MNSRENERRKKKDSKYRQVLFQSFVQRNSEKQAADGEKWSHRSLSSWCIYYNMCMWWWVWACLKVSDMVYETENPKYVPLYHTSSLFSRLKEPTVSLTFLLGKLMGIMLDRSKHELPIPPPPSAHSLFFSFSLPDNLLLWQSILKLELPFLTCSGWNSCSNHWRLSLWRSPQSIHYLSRLSLLLKYIAFPPVLTPALLPSCSALTGCLSCFPYWTPCSDLVPHLSPSQ